MRLLLASLFTLACSGSSGGPRERVHRFTGCSVPATVVRVEEQVGGDEARWSIHAKIIVPKSALPALVQSCGFRLDELSEERVEGDAAGVGFWDPPASDVASARHTDGKTLMVSERDTDVAVYVFASGD